MIGWRPAAAAILLATAGATATWAQGAPPSIGLPAAPSAPAAPAALPGGTPQSRAADQAVAYRRKLVADLYNQQVLEKQQMATVAGYDRRLKEALQEIIDAAKKPPDAQATPAAGGGIPVGPGGGGPGQPTTPKGPTPEGQRAHAYEMLIYQANVAKAELLATQHRVATLRELVNRPLPTAAQ